MNFVLWIIFGALAGWIASMIVKTNDQQGLVMDVVLGIIGSVVGGMLMNAFGYSGVTGFNIYSMIVAVIGSVVVISIGKMLRRA